MAINSNVTFDIARFLESRWTSFIGMIALWIVLSCVAWLILSEIQCISKFQLLTIIFIMFPTTFLFWCIQTKRWFQRSKYWPLCLFLLVLFLTIFLYDKIYPLFVAGTKYDLSYVRFWGTSLVFVILSLIIYCCYFCIGEHQKMCIVFLVSDKSTHEVDIKKALSEAQHKLEQKAQNLRVIIPPFGIANSIKQAERYINGHFNQADAVVYAKLIDSNEGEPFGYAFTDFTSRFSNRYIKEADSFLSVEHILRVTYEGHNWNTLNIEKDSISKTLEIAENLEHLYLMYACCLYMYKHQYSEAIEVTKILYSLTHTGNVQFDNFVKDIILNAYIISSRVEEHNNHNYQLARKILNECAAMLPGIRNTLTYGLAHARLLFYESDIRESKKVTKALKNRYPNADWYVNVNMAFYAIVERKPNEIYSNYKRLLKSPNPTGEEVRFVIHFLENEYRETTDRQYQLFLLHGLSLMYAYIDKVKSKKYLSKIQSYRRLDGCEALEKMQDLIRKNSNRLKIRQGQ